MKMRISPKAATALVHAAFLLGFATQGACSDASAGEVSIDRVIQRLGANESNALLVVIEGQYELARTDASGKPVFGRADRFFRFSRSNEVMKVERRGQYSADGVVRAEFDEIIFHSPDSTVAVSLPGATKAEKGPPERPSPFPLFYGFGLDYFCPSGCQRPEVRLPSVGWAQAKQEGLAICRKDPQNPKLIILEESGKDGRIMARHWIDSERGYLLVRMEVDLLVRGDSRQAIPFYRMEATPKRFDGRWFIASASSERRMMSTLDPDEQGFFMGTEREQIEITACRFAVDFKPGELEFSVSNFPNLTDIFDRTRSERLNLRTGERTPWGK
jgi:hypothetical protein